MPRNSIEPLPTPEPWGTSTIDPEQEEDHLLPKIDEFDLTKQPWHEDVTFQGVHFATAGTMAGSVSFIHIVHDINIKESLDHGCKLCSKKIEDTLNNITQEQAYVYQTMARVLTPKCNRIVDQLHDTYDTFVAGSDTVMTHPDFKEENVHSSANSDARSRRQLIVIGLTLLAM